MSNVGATTGKEPDFVDDGDLKTVEELRGAYKDLHKAKLSLNEKATVQGVMTEMKILRDLVDKSNEQMNKMVGMYGNVIKRIEMIEKARVTDLQVRINAGSTTPEDQDGHID